MQFRAAWVTTLSITALPLRHPVSGLLRDSHTFLQSSSSSLATPRNHCLGKCRITTIFRSILRLSTRSRFSRTNVHYSECTLKFLVKSNQPFCSPHPLGPILFPSKILSSPLGRIVREHHPRFRCSRRIGGMTKFGQFLDNCQSFVQFLSNFCPSFVNVK